MRTRRIIGTMAGALLLASPVQAGTIGVNFAGFQSGPGPVPLADTDTAGVVPQDHWNNVEQQLSGSLLNLVQDDDGDASTGSFSATAATLAWDDFQARQDNDTSGAASGHKTLMQYYHEVDEGNTTVTVSDLPSSITGAGYSVYLYSDHAAEDRTYEWTLDEDPNSAGGTQSFWIQSMDNFDADTLNYVQSTANVLADVGPSNYILFENLSADSFSLQVTDGDGQFAQFAALQGFQIVPNQAAPAVPEPASVVLLGCGGLALLRWRRRAM